MDYLIAEDGTVLTPEVLDELAKEAEAGYDLDKADVIVLGRPSINGRGVSPVLQVRVDDGLNEQLRALAGEQERTVSALVREALRTYVASSSR